jgi:hypothetical protein
LICTAHHDAREVIETRIPKAFSLIDDRQFVAADDFRHIALPKDKLESAFAVASPVSFRVREQKRLCKTRPRYESEAKYFDARRPQADPDCFYWRLYRGRFLSPGTPPKSKRGWHLREDQPPMIITEDSRAPLRARPFIDFVQPFSLPKALPMRNLW